MQRNLVGEFIEKQDDYMSSFEYGFYIASGWFNENQAKDLECIKLILDAHGVQYFSPKDEIICPPDANVQTRNKIFNSNVIAIRNSAFVIVNTRDKDMGTIFEAGVAFEAKKKIIYVAFGLQGNFNLMLAESGICVCTTPTSLDYAIGQVRANAHWTSDYFGNIE